MSLCATNRENFAHKLILGRESGARVGLVMDGAQPGDGHVCVELGGRERRMAQELLHHP